MGWLVGWSSKHELVEHLESAASMGRQRLVKSSLRGNHHWFIAEYEDKDGATVRYIGLNLLSGEGGEWGYKALCESMGPCELDVPIRWFDEVPLPEDSPHARAWREKVRQHYAARRAAPRPEVGASVSYGDHRYQLLKSLGRKGWTVRREDGQIFRMTCQQAAQAAKQSA